MARHNLRDSNRSRRPLTDSEDRLLAARSAALAAAAAAAAPGVPGADVLATARMFTGWLLSSAQLMLRVSPLTFEQGNPGVTHPTRLVMIGENRMAVAMTDAQYSTLTIDPTDSKNQPTADNGPFTWTEDSNGVTITLQPSADGTQCNIIAGTPGTANATVTDANGLTAVEAVTVTPGGAAALGLSASAPADVPPGGTTPPPGTSGH